MKIEIKSVADKGNPDKERLVLKVVGDTDIGNYLVMQTGYSGEEVTVGVLRAMWFTYKDLSVGDLVVIYSKSGKQSEKAIEGGKKAHFYYWSAGTAIWNSDNVAPVVLYAPEWESKTPNEL